MEWLLGHTLKGNHLQVDKGVSFCISGEVKLKKLDLSTELILLGNISTRASVSSGYPNTKKLMKAGGCRPSAFIASRCLDTLMKHEARVVDMTSQSRIINNR